MSSQQQPIVGTGPFQSVAIYRLVGPTLTVDASAGTVQVNSSSKFNTNLPLSHYMLITKIMYFINFVKFPVEDAVASVSDWLIGCQVTEALSRTIPAFSD